VCVNAAVEINVLDYNVAVRRRTSPYGAVRSVNRLETALNYSSVMSGINSGLNLRLDITPDLTPES